MDLGKMRTVWLILWLKSRLHDLVINILPFTWSKNDATRASWPTVLLDVLVSRDGRAGSRHFQTIDHRLWFSRNQLITMMQWYNLHFECLMLLLYTRFSGICAIPCSSTGNQHVKRYMPWRAAKRDTSRTQRNKWT
jgi:hypothetical protein